MYTITSRMFLSRMYAELRIRRWRALPQLSAFSRLRSLCLLLTCWLLLSPDLPVLAQTDTAWQRHHDRGVEAVSNGDLIAAEEAFRAAIEASDHFRDDDARRASTLNNMGYVLHAKGELAEARSYLEQSMVLRRTILGEYHPLVADSLANLGETARDAGEFDRAADLHERALAIRQMQYDQGHPKIAESLNDLGVLALAIGDHGKALSLHEQALELRTNAYGDSHPVTAISLGNLAATHHALGAYNKAHDLLSEELTIVEAALGENHPRVADSIVNRARLELEWQAFEGLETDLERALRIRTTSLGALHIKTAQAQALLAEALLRRGDPARAADLARSAIAVWEELSRDVGTDKLNTQSLLGRALAAQGQLDEAATLLEALTEEASTNERIESQALAVFLNNWATVLFSKGLYKDSLEKLNQALEIEEAAFGFEGIALAQTLRNLAAVHMALEDPAQARLALSRADAIEQREASTE